MSHVRVIERLITYDRRAFDNFLQGLQRRGWHEATKNREIGHGSIKNTMVHILNVHEWLLVGVAQGKPELLKNPGATPRSVQSWAELRRYRTRVWREMDALMRSLTEAKLRRRIKVPWLPGNYTLEDVFFQASFEQAHHLGEVIAAYWQTDTAPPQMMWVPILSGSKARVG